MMKPLVAANWKMHGNERTAREEGRAIAAFRTTADRVICPSFPYLATLRDLLKGSPVALGAQDCHAMEQGAHTGDVSAAMLKDLGCRYVILGHSERRAAYAETDALVADKAVAALNHGLTPILCVGESLSEREAGQAESRVRESVVDILGGIAETHKAPSLVIAYEPVWAIGTGKTPTLNDIETMHAVIADTLAETLKTVASGTRVLYGGSVKPQNAGDIAGVKGVGGFLVGGASLEAASFNAICRAAEAARVAA